MGVGLADGAFWIIQGLAETKLDPGGSVSLVSSQSSQPETYASSVRPVPSYSSDASVQDIVTEEQRLIQRAEAEGFFWDAAKVQRVVGQFVEKSGGSEHDVALVGPRNWRLIVRSTIKDSYGFAFRSPSQYLKRLENFNVAFPGLQMRMIGVSRNARGNGVIWTVQPFVDGWEFAEDSQLRKALEKAGWVRVGSDTVYRHKASGLVIRDAHTGNVLTDGTHLYPIDVIIDEMPAKG
jgi:predicted RNA binding protein YcfA (HicA-like mRNA interferase family)